MRLRLAAVCTALLLPALCLAQSLETGTPVVSGGHSSSALGTPLADADLAPGTLTVRVVRGGFAGNLSGRDVVLDVLGAQTRKVRTNDAGRAEFTDIPLGAHVRASVVVDGDHLESAVFPMPIDSGVRVLLATPQSGGTPVAVHGQAPETLPAVAMITAFPDPEDATPPPTASAPVRQARGDGGMTMTWVLTLTAAIFAAAVILRRPGSSRPS